MGEAKEADILISFLKKHFNTNIELSREEELALIEKTKGGDSKALDRLLHAHYRLIFIYARRYSRGNIPLEDAFQIAILGFRRAIFKYDLVKMSHCRLMTYARWWICTFIQRGSLEYAGALQIPAHTAQSVLKMRRECEKHEKITGEKPSLEWLFERIGLDINDSEKQVKIKCIIVAYLAGSVSFDAPLGEDNLAFGDTYHNPNQPDQLELVAEKEREDLIKKALQKLSPIEEAVLKYRRQELTQDDIAEKLNQRGFTAARKVSGERVRQIKEKALKKLKKSLEKKEKDRLVEALLP